ncbi:EthD protein [Shimia sp. SK013]|uniref:EthD family reductase n=1 Tax=Shimia sp. SK013 TaxID=1389006 RepID=UPI0006B42E28|nr:EthD family reductase [Shimia sp. SK013]KPA20869.1 EthD protein [Shimia sp. SK013]
MPVSMQVLYPVAEGTTFDHDYYATTHMALVAEHMGPHITSAQASKGLGGGGPDVPAPYHVIATIVFPDQPSMDAAMAASGPVMADVPNFTNIRPTVMIGEVLG